MDSFASAGWFPLSRQCAPDRATVGKERASADSSKTLATWSAGKGLLRRIGLQSQRVPRRMRTLDPGARTDQARNRQFGVPGTRQRGGPTIFRDLSLSPVRGNCSNEQVDMRKKHRCIRQFHILVTGTNARRFFLKQDYRQEWASK